MTSTIKLYRNCKILESRNFIVDDIAIYLATLSNTITINNFQYVKNNLNLNIKVNLSQEYLDFTSSNEYNYISIQNDSEKIVYYFVEKMNWAAESTIRLELIMDTINTFRVGRDFQISDKTIIQREHKDRFKLTTAAESITKDITTKCFCENELNGVFYNDIIVKTGGNNVVVNYITSVATVTVSDISGGVISLHVEFTDPFTRITITLNVSYTTTATLQRIIDPVSEGLQSPLFKKTEQDIIDNVDQRWYLVYKNNTAIDPTQYNPQNAIDVYLYTDMDLPIRIYYDANIKLANLNNGDYLIINTQNNPNSNISCNFFDDEYQVNRGIDVYSWYVNGEWNYQGIIIFRNANTLYCGSIQSVYRNNSWIYFYSYFYEVNSSGVYITNNGSTNAYKDTFSTISDLYSINYPITSNTSYVGNYTDTSIACNINSLDRTDSTLIKVIMIPYCPVNFKFENNKYVIDATWDISGNTLKMNDVNMNFENIINTSIDSPLKELYLKSFAPNTSDLRNDIYESKLLHSDFYMNQIIYDSFGYNINLENIDESSDEFLQESPNSFIIDWNTTNTIQSRFLAIFPQIKLKRSTQAFDNILYINRNNEMPIFTSPYFNYLRNGYNYDVKDKELNIEQADYNWEMQSYQGAIGVGNSSNIVSGLVNFGNFALSTLQGLKNNAYNAMKMESQIQRNLTTARNTAISVSAADDVNLLLKYCPVVKCITWQVGDNFLKSISDLFYYCGYVRNIQGIPSESSRYWFNFISAKLEIASTNNISGDILSDILTKYDEGVTILHHQNSSWDFEQLKENWEVSIL